MFKLNTLLKKLYRHKADLEFMMSICRGQRSNVFTNQFQACLKNIRRYESLTKASEKRSDLPGDVPGTPAADDKD